MTAVRRPNALALVLDVTRRLAEDFTTVPLPMVSRCVQRATNAVRLFGEDISAAIDVVERIAREDLTVIVEQRADGAPAPAALAG